MYVICYKRAHLRCLMLTGDIPNWWVWGYWVSPLSYAFNAFSVNEMFAPRWDKRVSRISFHHQVKMWLNGLTRNLFLTWTFHVLQSSSGLTSLGVAVLNNFDVFTEKNWYWIGTAALIGFIIFFNVLFTLALMYLNRKHSHSVQTIYWITSFLRENDS